MQLHRVDGDETADRLGSAAVGIGDVNGDGIPDFVAGAIIGNSVTGMRGYVRAYSGSNHATLYTVRGNSALDFFGDSVGAAGDVNGDGIGDFVVGAAFDDPMGTSSGAAFVYSGVDGALLYTLAGESANDQFGASVDGAGDVDADGFDDFVVGAWLHDTGGPDAGRVKVYSGRTGAVLHTWDGDAAEDNFGYSVAGAGDVDADGFADVAVGAYRADTNGSASGTVIVFSGFDGGILYRFHGDAAGDELGYAVASAGDVDQDGHADIIAGAVGDDDNGSRCGSARVYSGASGAVLYTFFGDDVDDWFGNAVACAGDVDGDSVPDLLIGAFQGDSANPLAGYARVFSGATGAVLFDRDGDSGGDRFGWSVGHLGDVDGDGYADVMVGARLDDHNNDTDNGSVYVYDAAFSGNSPSRERIYGRACPGTGGRLPRIGYRGRAFLGQTIDITLRGAVGSQSNAVLFIGSPFGVALDVIGLTGCTLYANPWLDLTLATDVNGMAEFGIPVANDPNVLGALFNAQWIVPDVGAPTALPLTLSDALQITLGG